MDLQQEKTELEGPWYLLHLCHHALADALHHSRHHWYDPSLLYHFLLKSGHEDACILTATFLQRVLILLIAVLAFLLWTFM